MWLNKINTIERNKSFILQVKTLRIFNNLGFWGFGVLGFWGKGTGLG